MKLYDCFTFFNEFELLELRLEMLKGVAEYFVLVEADRTHKNQRKEFLFEEDKARFGDWADKIIHIKVDDMPEYDPDVIWKLENYQRNCIVRGLENIEPDDIVVVSDIDEIPKPETLSFLKTKSNMLDNQIFALEQKLFYYFVNLKCKDIWSGSVVAKAKNIISPQHLRNGREVLPLIKDSGWHFSYLGGVDRIILKINSIVDAMSVADTAKVRQIINNRVYNGLDLFGREGSSGSSTYEYEFINIEDHLPHEILSLVKKYPYLHFTPPESAGPLHSGTF